MCFFLGYDYYIHVECRHGLRGGKTQLHVNNSYYIPCVTMNYRHWRKSCKWNFWKCQIQLIFSPLHDDPWPNTTSHQEHLCEYCWDHCTITAPNSYYLSHIKLMFLCSLFRFMTEFGEKYLSQKPLTHQLLDECATKTQRPTLTGQTTHK